MKQTKLTAIMQAQKIYAATAMAGYQTSMSIYAEDCTKEIEVTIFYKNTKEEKEIEEIIKINGKYGDKIEHKSRNNYQWINYTTYYE